MVPQLFRVQKRGENSTINKYKMEEEKETGRLVK
jgi:hypothetical protein